jgi:hypothetical protein
MAATRPALLHPDDKAQPAGSAEIEDVIKEILNAHSYIHEKRIQKLLFLADLYSIQTRGKRLIDADFKPYYYGVFSDKVSLALQTLSNVKTAFTEAPDGSEVLTFLRPEKPFRTGMSAGDRKLIKLVLYVYRNQPTEMLADIGKHSLLWQSAEHGQPFDYAKYLADPAVRISPRMARAYHSARRAGLRGNLRTAPNVRELLRSLTAR